MDNRQHSKKKIIIFSITASLGLVMLLMFFFYSFSNTLKEERKQSLKEIIEIGMSQINYFYEKELSGKFTRSEAKGYAMQALEKATFGKSGYYWIHQSDGKMLMLPYFPKLVGTNFASKKDKNGLYFNQEMTKVAKDGGGIVEYYWENPDTNQVTVKASEVDYFEPWDWILGTGVFFDETNKEVKSIIIKNSGLTLFAFIAFIILAFNMINSQVQRTGVILNSDPLTGLYSKRSIKGIIKSVEKRYKESENKVLAVVFMDLDDFKDINSNLGHSGGDKVLIAFSKILRKFTRSSDYCIRFGGDEFVFISEFDSKDSVLKLAERVRKATNSLEYTSDKGPTIRASISIGIATYSDSDKDLSLVIDRADKNLYESKKLGKNRIFG